MNTLLSDVLFILLTSWSPIWIFARTDLVETPLTLVVTGYVSMYLFFILYLVGDQGWGIATLCAYIAVTLGALYLAWKDHEEKRTPRRFSQKRRSTALEESDLLLLFEKKEELREALGIDIDEDLDPELVSALAEEVKIIGKKRKALEKKRRRSQVASRLWT